jgi:glycosyltransferase involved in cell wall biosynthesis
MRVLISAIACHPHGGSESYFGWAAINALATKHDLTVLTHVKNIDDITQAAAGNEALSRIRFIGIGDNFQWHSNRMMARLQSWHEYKAWSRAAHEKAAELLALEAYNLGHHITYSTWRQVSPLANLGIPWILGPIGGGERFPSGFRRILSLQSRLFELARDASSQLSMRSVPLRRAIQSASIVLASTPETRELLLRMGVPAAYIRLAPAAFIHSDRVELFKATRPKTCGACLRIFAGGNLEGRKGLALALKALASLKERGVPFEFIFGGYGPELPHLRQLANRLSLDEGCVIFRPSLPLAEYRQVLQVSNVYLLPSLRESGGLTLGEAMLAGCVPVVIKAGGPSLLVTSECGYAFAPTSPDRTVNKMTDALQELWCNAEHRTSLSINAIKRAEAVLSEDRYVGAVEAAYLTGLKR